VRGGDLVVAGGGHRRDGRRGGALPAVPHRGRRRARLRRRRATRRRRRRHVVPRAPRGAGPRAPTSPSSWPGSAFLIALLLPLVGIITAFAARLQATRVVHDRAKLQEANRLLAALLDLADDLPGGLDATTVAAAVCSEVRALPGVPAVVVFVEDRGVLHAAASHALHPGRLPTLRMDVVRRIGDLQLRTSRQLPVDLRRACVDQPFWLGARLGTPADPVGLLLVGVDSAEVGVRIRPLLVRLAGDAAIALQNARLFDGTLARAADAARRRFAADLHDGVAQSLAHLKMELELQTVQGGVGRGLRADAADAGGRHGADRAARHHRRAPLRPDR
jgi:hypothetical protein